MAVLDAMENAVRQVHQELRANKVTKVYLDFRARKVTEVNKETLVRTVNLDTMVNKEKTVQLVCPVFPVKWDLVVSLDKEDSQVFQDLQESQEVKDHPALKVTLDHLEDPVLQVRLDPTDQLVHLDRKVC